MKLQPIKILVLLSCLFLLSQAARDDRYQAYKEVYLLSLQAYDSATQVKDKSEAAWVLAQLYESGKGVAKDLQQSLKWYKRSAKYGSIKAMEYLIRYYFSVKRDLEKGLFWAHKAAVKGSDLGISSIGLFFEQANELEKAAKWYQKGAAGEGVFSMYHLGMMYKNGIWYHKDDKKALFWLQKAAKKGNTKAQKALK